MAEKNEVEEQIQVSTPNDSQIAENNEQVSGEDQSFDVFIQDVIYKFVNHLPENEISGETRGHICVCVKSIIKAHKRILQDVKAGSQKVMNVLKTSIQKKTKEINQLRCTIIKLRDSTCEECKKKITTGDFSSLSVQDKTESPMSSETKVDGRAQENEDDKTEIVANLGSEFPLPVNVRCPVASCGLVALLCLFKRKKIPFCPTKFVRKYQKVTRHKPLKCTTILQDLSDLLFLERVGDLEQVNEGEHDKILATAKNKLCVSQQEAGLLSYSTDSYNHCVTVYITGEGEIEIHDADTGIDYIEDLEQIRSYELLVLKCDRNGVPKIENKWSDECDISKCMQEFHQLSGPVSHDGTSLHSSDTSKTLD